MKIKTVMAAVGLALGLSAACVQAKVWKTVRVGMDATYPPFESVDPKGQIVGWEVDYANKRRTVLYADTHTVLRHPRQMQQHREPCRALHESADRRTIQS